MCSAIIFLHYNKDSGYTSVGNWFKLRILRNADKSTKDNKNLISNRTFLLHTIVKYTSKTVLSSLWKVDFKGALTGAGWTPVIVSIDYTWEVGNSRFLTTSEKAKWF